MIAALRHYPAPCVGLESRSTTDMRIEHRWRCDCGRVGVWLAIRAHALSNGLDHEDEHAMGVQEGKAS